jgi:hypothetical protein
MGRGLVVVDRIDSILSSSQSVNDALELILAAVVKRKSDSYFRANGYVLVERCMALVIDLKHFPAQSAVIRGGNVFLGDDNSFVLVLLPEVVIAGKQLIQRIQFG